MHRQDLGNGADLMQSIWLDCRRKAAVQQYHEAFLKVKADDLQRCLPEAQQCAMAQAHEKGDSGTITTTPVAEHGLFLYAKAHFHDHLDHAQICKLSGFIHMHHNNPTDILTSCMKAMISKLSKVATSYRRIPPALHHQY